MGKIVLDLQGDIIHTATACMARKKVYILTHTKLRVRVVKSV